MNLVKRVKELVAVEKMTIAELERELDFSNGSIRHWDDSLPAIDKVMRVAEYFCITVDEFVKGEPEDSGECVMCGEKGTLEFEDKQYVCETCAQIQGELAEY